MGLFVVAAHDGARLRFLAVRPENLPLFFTWSFAFHAVLLLGFGALITGFITLYGLHHENSRTSFHCLMERPVSPGLIYLLRCLAWGSPVVASAIISMPVTGLLVLLGFTLYGSGGTAIAAWSQVNIISDMAVRGMAWMAVHGAWWTGSALMIASLFDRWWIGLATVCLGVNMIALLAGPQTIAWAMPPGLLLPGLPAARPDQFAGAAPIAMTILGVLAACAILTGYLAFRRKEVCP